MLTQDRHTYNSRNQTSLINFVDGVFDKYAKLLPVRIDLGYKTNRTVAIDNRDYHHNNQMDYLLDPSLSPHAYLKQNEIISNWNKLLNLLRWNHSKLLKDLIGYAWKIEYGEDKGIHYHVILFFNGHRVQKDYYYADKLGKLWLVITKDYGVYFNCSSDKTSRYGENNALKVTHRNDDRTNLYQATQYLTKIDINEDNARELSNGRIFGKSNC